MSRSTGAADAFVRGPLLLSRGNGDVPDGRRLPGCQLRSWRRGARDRQRAQAGRVIRGLHLSSHTLPPVKIQQEDGRKGEWYGFLSPVLLFDPGAKATRRASWFRVKNVRESNVRSEASTRGLGKDKCISVLLFSRSPVGSWGEGEATASWFARRGNEKRGRRPVRSRRCGARS